MRLQYEAKCEVEYSIQSPVTPRSAPPATPADQATQRARVISAVGTLSEDLHARRRVRGQSAVAVVYELT